MVYYKHFKNIGLGTLNQVIHYYHSNKLIHDLTLCPPQKTGGASAGLRAPF